MSETRLRSSGNRTAKQASELQRSRHSLHGLGSATKRAIRAARQAWDESQLQRNAPYEMFKWQALQNIALFPDYFFHVLPDHKLIYIEVPKTASSYILGELQKIGGNKDTQVRNIHMRSESGFFSPRSVGIVAFVRLLEDPETLIFTSVRNPYTRLVSCYFDKFQKVSIGDGSYISNIYIAYRRMTAQSISDGSPITFEDFVQFICFTAPLRLDGHWCRQADIIPTSIASPHLEIRFETMEPDFATVRDRFQTLDGQVNRPKSIKPATSESRIREVLNGKLSEAIYSTYEIDFLRFGYDRTI